MQPMQRRLMGALVGLVALGLGACSAGDTKVRGRVSDGVGTQAQAQQASAQGTLGGSGTVASTTRVRVSRVDDAGALQVQGEAQVQAEGRYELDVPAEEQRLVLEALDASGQVLASALLDASGEAGKTAVAPPMDAESSLEAQVFVQLVKDGMDASDTDTVDLRARIDARMAKEARAAGSAALASYVSALAQGVRAAQEAELRTYAEAGVGTSQGELFEAELAASAQLNAALDASGSSAQAAAAAYETFYAELTAAAQRLGAEAHEHAQAQSSASASFRLSLEARLPEQSSKPFVDAAAAAAGSLEARSSGAALSALLSAAGAADAAKTQAASAAAQLRAQVDAAQSASAAAQAFSRFSASVATDSNVQATVLGSFLGVNVTNTAGVALAVQAATSASAVLDSALDIAASGAVSAAGGASASALATGTAQAYDSFATGLRNQASVLSAFGARSTPAMELLIVTEGSFRAAN